MSLAVPGLDTTASTNDHQDAQSKIIADLLKRIDTLNDENLKLKTQLRLRTQQSSTQHKPCLKEKTFEERAKNIQHSNTERDLGEGTSSCTTQHSVKVSAASGNKKKAQTFGLPSASPGREDVRTRGDGEAGSSRDTRSSLAVQQKRRSPAMVEATEAKQMRANFSRGNKRASTSQIAQQPSSSAVDVPTNAVSARVLGNVDDDDDEVIFVENNEDSDNGEGGFTPCNKRRCGACRFAPSTKTIKSSRNGKSFRIKHNINCESSKVIYVITCKKCGIQYTGQTTKKLKTRFSNHRSTVNRDQQDQHIAKHYKQKDHSIDDMELTGVELVADASKLYQQESKWMWRLETHCAYGGLNVEEPFLSHCKPPAS